MRTYDGLIYMSWAELTDTLSQPIDAIFNHAISATAVRDDSVWGIALTGMNAGCYDVFRDWFNLHAVDADDRASMYWSDNPAAVRVLPPDFSNHFLSSIWGKFEIRGAIATDSGVLFSPERFYA